MMVSSQLNESVGCCASISLINASKSSSTAANSITVDSLAELLSLVQFFYSIK
jgi:hypothetical protein